MRAEERVRREAIECELVFRGQLGLSSVSEGSREHDFKSSS